MRFLWQRAVWPVFSEAASLAVCRRNEKGGALHLATDKLAKAFPEELYETKSVFTVKKDKVI